MRRWPLAIGVFLLALAAATSGEPESDEPTSSPQRAFDWTVGDWTGVRRDGADGSEAPMTMRVESILGGAGQLRRLEVKHAGGVYRGLSVQVFDHEEGVWRRQYANDVRGRFSPLEATEVDGARSVWRGTSPARTRESRLVSEHVDPDRWLRTMSISEDGGKTWRDLWIDDLRRTGGPQGQSQPNTPPVRSP